MTRITSTTTEQASAGERIDALDLDPIAYKMMHPEPGQQAITLADADQRITAYRHFLKLCAWYPGESIVPSKTIDEVWHTHILDTAKYADDSTTVFGHFMHHFPYLGLRGDDDEAALHDAYARTCELFRLHFGIDPATTASVCSECSSDGKCGKCTSCSRTGADQSRPRPDRAALA